MVSGKLNIPDFVWFFSPEENEAIIHYLQKLVLNRTAEVEEFLSLLADSKVPLSGFSTVINYFELIKALELPVEKRNLVYNVLKEVPAEEFLQKLTDSLENQKEEVISSPEISRVLDDSVNKQSPLEEQSKTVPNISQRNNVAYSSTSQYYQIDDEEYMVKSRYVHPSLFGVEEGYPPFIRKKKKVQTEY